MSIPPANAVRRFREARDWSQADLAARAGISRSGLSAIESGRLEPSVATALSLAQALGCSVEALFAPTAAVPCEWAFPPAVGQQRFWTAQVGGRNLAFPVEAANQDIQWHDGTVDHGKLDGGSELAEQTLVVAGCDPAANLLALEYAAQSRFRMLVLRRGSGLALKCLAAGLVHVAGVHYSHGRKTAANRLAAQAQLGAQFRLVHVARWEEGLAVGGLSKAPRVADLLQDRAAWIGREAGSSARECLDEVLEGRFTPGREAMDHRGVVSAIQCGWGRVGPCVRLAAVEAGLQFLPIRREDYEFCMPAALESEPRIVALLQTLRSEQFRRRLGELPGYSTKRTGEIS